MRWLLLFLPAILGGCSPAGLVNTLAPRDDFRLVADLAYGDNPRQKLDLYLPLKGDGPKPVVLFFYGGNWDSGSKADYLFLGEALASRGFVVAIADYRIYPEVKYPDFLEDGAAAARWTLAHIAQYGGDPARVSLMGHSAGAYNAMMLALDPEWLGPERARIRSVVGLAGPYDFLPLTDPTLQIIFGTANDLTRTQPIAIRRRHRAAQSARDRTPRHGRLPRQRHAARRALDRERGQSRDRALRVPGAHHPHRLVRAAAPLGDAGARRRGRLPCRRAASRALMRSGKSREDKMAERTRPPFRAEHVGSLLRPPQVMRARDDFAAGRITAQDLRAIEDRAIRDAVKKQEELGLGAVTDGEMRRRSWHMDFFYGVGGLEKIDEKVQVPFHNESGDFSFSIEGLKIAGKLRLEQTIFAEDFAYLKSVARAVPKLTIPSPSVMHRRGGRLLDRTANPGVARIYADVDAFFHDLSAVYADEIERLGKLGLTYLQIDDTSWASLCDPEQRAQMNAAGSDGERVHLTYIRAINDALKRKPADMAVVTHTCRGNFRSSWIASGGYDFIAEPLFSGLDVDGFFLEYDDARSGGFAPLRFVPKGKMVVLGLVTSKKGALEKKDDLKRRIDEAAKYVPLEQICLSPQCGFSSTVEGNILSEEEQWAKLRLVVEVAREVWG